LARLNVHHGSPEPEPTVLRDDPGLQLRPNHFHALPIRLADNLFPASPVLAPALACEFLHPGANSREIVGSTHHFLPGFDGERRLTGLVLYSARRVYGEARPKTGRDDQDLFFALRCNRLTMRPAKRGVFSQAKRHAGPRTGTVYAVEAGRLDRPVAAAI
jgi:hypothetical protein